MSVNVISLFNICVKREIHERQISPFIVIFSEELVSFGIILREIAEVMFILGGQEFTTSR